MNLMPSDWSSQLQSLYPARSGPCGWRGMKLMLALRRALMDATWPELIEGTKRYASYCRQAGIEGTSYVKTPQTFFEDGSWAENYEFKVPETKDQQVRRELDERDQQRMAKAIEAGRRFVPPIEILRGESVGAFETRIKLAGNFNSNIRASVVSGISQLADKMRMPK